jgi:TetR/AcrR family transcriptional regulator, cholesterol catabolism regulator
LTLKCVVLDRTQRIVQTAITLAEEGGFEAVRLRDVAAQANVALGTVYKRFSSKEEILVAGIVELLGRTSEQLDTKPIGGSSDAERMVKFFSRATRALCAKPKLTRALIRAVASGDPERSGRVTQFYDQSTALVLRNLDEQLEDRDNIARIFQQVWFAALVGWASGLNTANDVIDQTSKAIELMFRADGP